MINAREALNIILESVHPLETITVSLLSARGYAIAENVIANESIPPFDNTAMDGFAIRSEDARNTPTILTVVGEIAAGTVFEKTLCHGEAVSIMTGAKIPNGSDAVVQVEWTEKLDDTHVKILRAVPVGHNIRRAGGDIKEGACVLEKGQELRPQEIGVLASVGKRFVEIHRPARVAILTTGNEIVEVHQPLTGGKIRNSNAYTLMALVDEIGAEAINLGIAKDDRMELKNKILEGLNADALITSGGVSVGKYDLVMDVLKEVGVEIKFWKVNIKPGMPLLFGISRGNYVFGLPGNPVSTMVTFLKFVKPALLKMTGRSEVDSGFKLHAKLEHEIKKTDGKRHFVRGILENRNGVLIVRSTGSQISNVLTSLAKANCLIIIPEEKEVVAAGEEVEVELL